MKYPFICKTFKKDHTMKTKKASFLIGFTFFLLFGCMKKNSQFASKSATLIKPASSKQFKTEELRIQLLEPGLWLVTHLKPWPANSLVVKMLNGDLLLVDTPYTPKATAKLLKWVDKTFSKPKIVAINTHYHWDALGGNSALLQHNVPIYGSDLTVQLLRQNQEIMRKQVAGWLKKRPKDAIPFLSLKAAPPNKIFPLEQGKTLSFGDENVEIIYPGHGHSADGVVVYFPSRKLLFGSCAVVAGKSLGNTSDADLESWPLAMKRLKKLALRKVIPGHGQRTETDLIEHTICLLKSPGKCKKN